MVGGSGRAGARRGGPSHALCVGLRRSCQNHYLRAPPCGTPGARPQPLSSRTRAPPACGRAAGKRPTGCCAPCRHCQRRGTRPGPAGTWGVGWVGVGWGGVELGGCQGVRPNPQAPSRGQQGVLSQPRAAAARRAARARPPPGRAAPAAPVDGTGQVPCHGERITGQSQLRGPHDLRCRMGDGGPGRTSSGTPRARLGLYAAHQAPWAGLIRMAPPAARGHRSLALQSARRAPAQRHPTPHESACAPRRLCQRCRTRAAPARGLRACPRGAA